MNRDYPIKIFLNRYSYKRYLSKCAIAIYYKHFHGWGISLGSKPLYSKQRFLRFVT